MRSIKISSEYFSIEVNSPNSHFAKFLFYDNEYASIIDIYFYEYFL